MTDNNRYANAFVQPKGVSMRDAERWEKEQQELANLEKAPKGEENPNDTLEPSPNTPPNDDEHDWKKRYADLQSHAAKKEAAAKQAAEALKQELLLAQQKLKEADSKPKSYPFTKEQIKEWSDQFPDFHKFMDTVIDMKYDERSVALQEEITRMENQLKGIALERGRAELLKLHPDAFEIETDPQFISWLEGQKPQIKALIESPNPADIAEGLSIYKMKMGIKDKAKAKQDEDREASKAITVKSQAETPKDKKVWKESEIDKMDARTYAKYADDIDLARAEGRFEKDLNPI